jgi:arginine repressor
MSQADLKKWFEQEFDTKIDQSTVSRILKKKIIMTKLTYVYKIIHYL